MRLRRLVLVALFSFAPNLYSQTAALHEVHSEGQKTLTEAQIVQLSGLTPDTQVGKQELQGGADILVRSGLFAKVTYNFTTHNDAVIVTFHVEENPRLKVTYDNFPWFSDSELGDAIRRDLPFYDGTLPEAGSVVDIASNSLAAFLTSHGTAATIGHDVVQNPLGEGSLLQFHAEGIAPTIASIEFSDPNLINDRYFQQHLPEIQGKPYSRMTIDIFLAEAIRPIYQQQGFLKATIGPPDVRLSGNPNQKLPEAIPVFVPCKPGTLYQLGEITFNGNTKLSTITLTNAVGVKTGDVANGVLLEGGWDHVREEYSRIGYLEAKVEAVPSYDDQAHKVSYRVDISEGTQFRFNAMTVTGMSLAGEQMLREAWTIHPGEVFDKTVFEALLTRLETKRVSVFKELPVHYDTVGHWLQTDDAKGTVDVLLDFK